MYWSDTARVGLGWSLASRRVGRGSVVEQVMYWSDTARVGLGWSLTDLAARRSQRIGVCGDCVAGGAEDGGALSSFAVGILIPGQRRRNPPPPPLYAAEMWRKFDPACVRAPGTGAARGKDLAAAVEKFNRTDRQRVLFFGGFVFCFVLFCARRRGRCRCAQPAVPYAWPFSRADTL